MRSPNDVSFFGRTTARSTHRAFGIRQSDRLSHCYVVGKTGTGKSSLLETLLLQDIAQGRGCALIDPHGDLAERLARSAPAVLRTDLHYLDMGDAKQPYGYNPLLQVSADLRSLVASGAIDLFKMLWSDAWGVRMEHILRNALLALLEQPHATLADILALLTEKSYRLAVAANVTNEQVRSFWLREYPRYSFRYQADGIAPIQNKVGAFLADPRLRRFLVPARGGLRFREVMDRGQVLLINLAQGKIGADSAHLLGGLLMTAIGSAAFSRAFIGEGQRRPFFLYADEFQNFTTLAVANMLSELRKYGLGMTLAHQYLEQLEGSVRHAVLGNAGSVIAFRVGGADAPVLSRELSPVFEAADLLTLPNRHIAVKLLIDGAPSHAFSACTLTPEEGLSAGHAGVVH